MAQGQAILLKHCIAFACGEFGFSFAATFFHATSRVEVHGGAHGGPSSPLTEAAFSEMAHGTAHAASASATGQPSARRSSSPDSSRESGRQSRSCSFEGGEKSSRGDGRHRQSGCRVSEGGVGEGKKGLPETPTPMSRSTSAGSSSSGPRSALPSWTESAR